MGPAGTSSGAISIQHIPGRRIHLPRRAAAQDERRLWKMGLGCERRCLRAVPSSPTLGLAREYPARLAVGFHRQALPQQLVPHPPPFRAEYLLYISDPGPGFRASVITNVY